MLVILKTEVCAAYARRKCVLRVRTVRLVILAQFQMRFASIVPEDPRIPCLDLRCLTITILALFLVTLVFGKIKQTARHVL